MNKLIATLAAALAIALGGASAQTIDGTDTARILALAKGYGSATLDRDRAGDPRVVGTIGGTKYAIYFYGCTDNANCKSVTFQAGWTMPGVSQDRINSWNSEKRFGTAYLDGDRDPNIKMTVNLYSGVTEENFSDSIDWWRVVLDQYKQHLAE